MVSRPSRDHRDDQYIIYDRFESTSNGKTTVAYVARKGSANERGYASVLVFTADTSNRFEKEDFEKIVSSFRYFSARVLPVPCRAKEIPRVMTSSGSDDPPGRASELSGKREAALGCSR